MPMWTWIVIGVGSATVASLVIGLALARVLGVIGHGVSELYESEFWLSWEPPRRVEEEAEATTATHLHLVG